MDGYAILNNSLRRSWILNEERASERTCRNLVSKDARVPDDEEKRAADERAADFINPRSDPLRRGKLFAGGIAQLLIDRQLRVALSSNAPIV